MGSSISINLHVWLLIPTFHRHFNYSLNYCKNFNLPTILFPYDCILCYLLLLPPLSIHSSHMQSFAISLCYSIPLLELHYNPNHFSGTVYWYLWYHTSTSKAENYTFSFKLKRLQMHLLWYIPIIIIPTMYVYHEHSFFCWYQLHRGKLCKYSGRISMVCSPQWQKSERQESGAKGCSFY